MQLLTWGKYWWDTTVLAQLQVVTGILGAGLALIAIIYARRVATRQFMVMEDQGVIIDRQLRMLEEQAATSKRIEEITRRQAEIAEVQHKIMIEQLARKSALRLFLRASQPHVVQIGSRVVSVTWRYLVAVQNSGNKTAEHLYWRLYLADDERLRFELPPEFDQSAMLQGGQGTSVYKGEGRPVDPVLPGGMTDLFWFTMFHQLTDPDAIVPKMKGYVRCEDGRFPQEGEAEIDFRVLGVPPKE